MSLPQPDPRRQPQPATRETPGWVAAAEESTSASAPKKRLRETRSCRSQIAHGSGREAVHAAVVLAGALGS